MLLFVQEKRSNSVTFVRILGVAAVLLAGGIWFATTILWGKEGDGVGWYVAGCIGYAAVIIVGIVLLRRRIEANPEADEGKSTRDLNESP